MKRIILVALLALAGAAPARSACVAQGAGLHLGIPALGDPGTTFATCIRNTLLTLNAINGSSITYSSPTVFASSVTFQAAVQVSSSLYVTGKVGIGTPPAAPGISGSSLTVAGFVESTRGGFKFPDGSTMATSRTFPSSTTFQAAVQVSSNLVVNGIIQSTTGGVKFPDGSIQTSAGISAPVFHGFSVTMGAQGSIASGTTIGLSSMNVVGYDVDSVITGTGTFTAHQNGYFQFLVCLSFTTSGDQAQYIVFLYDDAGSGTIRAQTSSQASGTSALTVCVNSTLKLASGTHIVIGTSLSGSGKSASAVPADSYYQGQFLGGY